MKDIKQKKKKEKRKEMERNVRRSPRVIDIKWFYKESFFLGTKKRKKTKEGSPKNWISMKGSVSLDFGVVSVLLGRGSGLLLFVFLAGVPLELSGHSRFQAIFKTSDTEVNLLHVFFRRESREMPKKIEEGGTG